MTIRNHPGLGGYFNNQAHRPEPQRNALRFDKWESYYKAVIASMAVAVITAVTGLYAILRRVVFLPAALSQVSGLGVVAAFFLAASVPALAGTPLTNPWLLALGVTLIAAMLLGWLPEPKGLSREAVQCLEAYPFPGNVRELENEIERAMAMAEGGKHIEIFHLSDRLQDKSLLSYSGPKSEGPLKQIVEAVEKSVLSDRLIKHRGNKTRVARDLGLSRNGLMKKMQRYGL